MFGLTNSEGNHGEDVKEYWWYLDATPSSAWLKWRYHYPQAAYPVRRPGRGERPRGRDSSRSTSCSTRGSSTTTGTGSSRSTTRRRIPTDILARITVRNAGPDPATIHVLPTLWFRNEWSWDPSIPRPSLVGGGRRGPILASHPALGDYELHLGGGPDGAAPELLFCENETNAPRVYGAEATTAWPKDGINDHVVAGAATVNPAQTGTKAAAWYRLTVAPGATAELRLRLRPRAAGLAPERPGRRASWTTSFATIMALRNAEADEFYAGLRRPGATDDEAMVMRQAFAGMLWSKQYYAYDVGRWLDGDPAGPPPPPERAERAQRRAGATSTPPTSCRCPTSGSTRGSRRGTSRSTRSRWPTSTRHSRSTSCSSCAASGSSTPTARCPRTSGRSTTSTRPSMPSPPLEVWRIDGERDTEFLERDLPQAAAQLHVVAEPPGRGGQRPVLGRLPRARQPERARPVAPAGRGPPRAVRRDGLDVRLLPVDAGDGQELALRDPAYGDLVTTFLERAVRIAGALNESGLWDETDGFYYDSLRLPDGTSVALRIHSMVGLLPVLPAVTVPRQATELGAALGKHFARFLASSGVTDESLRSRGSIVDATGGSAMILSLLPPVRLERVLREVLSEDAFLSPHGLRALSRRHLAEPFRVEIEGLHGVDRLRARGVDDEPVRRQLELARAGLVPGQLPVHRVAAALGRGARG